MAARSLAPHFTLGRKELFLPNVNITFLRTDNLPAHQAKFEVPLAFSKLDIRDYLFHVYNTRVLKVRSYVKQSRVTQGDPNNPRPQPRRWHRPRALKYMTVDLEKPFVWPERPDKFESWNKVEVETADRESEEMRKSLSPTGDTVVNVDRRTKMREQAKLLLERKVAWQSTANHDPLVLRAASWRPDVREK